MKPASRSMAALSLLAACVAPSVAAAQETALDRFDPAPAGDRFFGVQAPGTRGHLDVHADLVMAYGHNPFVFTHRRGVTDVGNFVEHQMNLHLLASFSLWDRLNLSLDMPFALLQRGNAIGPGGVLLDDAQPADGAAVGDLRFGARGSIFGEDGAPFQLGVGGYLWLPTGASNDYVSDKTVRGSVEALLGGTVGPLVWNFSVGPYFRNSHTLIGIEQGHSLVFGAGLGLLLGEDKQVQVGPESKVSITLADPNFRNTNAEVLLGAKYRFADYFTVGLAAGPGVSEGIGTPDFRGIASFGFSTDVPERPFIDADQDGIEDKVDACPGQPGPASKDAEKHGCPPPPPPPDQDADGVADGVDACPTVAGVASDVVALNGCPPDGDGDGTRDDQDLCPEVPAGPTPDPTRFGCPAADSDGDGVFDHLDACKDIAGVATTDSSTTGCPADTDGDGFRDDQDACPDLRGTDDPDPTKRGCPKTVRLVGQQIQILQQVQFATGTALIKSESDALLDEVAQVLVDHPELIKVEVAGHTDDRGSNAVNTRLSQQRADAVKKALVDRKVDGSRLTAKGYGPSDPIADNASDDGRAKNRRVEFRILERKPK